MTKSFVAAGKHVVRSSLACTVACAIAATGVSFAFAQEDAAAVSARGRSLIHQGKLKQAEAELKKAARLDKNSIESLYDLARLEFATGDLRRARNACKALVKKDEHALLSQVCQARAYLLWRRASRAEEFLETARAMDGGNPEVLLAFADMKRVSGELEASKAAYQQVISSEPSNADAYFGLGQLSLVLPDRAAAKKAFSDALAREPDWLDAQYELGRLSQGPDAVALLDKVVAARPDWVEAKLALGTARLENGDAAGAETLFRSVLKLQPKNPAVHAKLGMVLAAKQDWTGAEAELAQGAAGLPNDVETALALARVYVETDRAEEAFTQFRTASSLDKKSPVALIEAGVFALKISRNALAQAFLEKAIERAPSSAEAQARYADSLLARGEKDAAKEHYKLALAGEGAIDRKDVQHRLDALE